MDGVITEVHTTDPERPHRLASILYTRDGWTREYTPDTRGRVTSDSSGRELGYTPFDLPRTIHEPATDAAPDGEDVTFAYDAFGDRVKKTASIDGVLLHSTITLGLYERREIATETGPQVTHVF